MGSEWVRGQSDNLPFVSGEMVAHYLTTCDKYNVPETRGVKIERSKRKTYGDNAIGRVQVKREEKICTVMAEVTPEHKVRQKGYKISCKVDEAEDEIVEANCQDCPASKGGCKHEIAFVMWLHRRSEEPEPTSVVCYWKKSKLSHVGNSEKYMPIENLVTADNTSKKQYPPNNEFFNTVVEKMKTRRVNFQLSPHCYDISNHLTNVSLHKLLNRFGKTGRTSVDDFLSFATHSMTDLMCKEVEEYTRAQSESVLWAEMRYGRITASKMYEIAHCHTTDGSLVDQIIGASRIKDAVAMARGRKLEKKVIKKLAKLLHLNVTNSGLFLIPTYPVLGASPDGPDSIGNDFVVEIKCPANDKTEKNYINSSGLISERCLVQIQLQMFMTGKKRRYFCVAKPDFEISSNFTYRCIDYDETFITEIISRSMQFWRQIIFPRLHNIAVPSDNDD